jgi:hypothetical protein
MNYLTHFSRPLRRLLFAHGIQPMRCAPPAAAPAQRILIVGIYLTDFPSQASQLVRDYAASSQHHVEQQWAALGRQPAADAQLSQLTATQSKHMIPKFLLLNQMLRGQDLSPYDYIIFSDDDVALCPDFIDHYIGWVHHFGLSIAQPARTPYSHRDHKFCLQMRAVKARETRFVEIGPLFSFDRQAIASLLPFNENSPMGWGQDLVWPVIAEKQQLRMGIVDATPVDHSYRAQSKTYKSKQAWQAMQDYLQAHESLSPEHAKVNLRVYR